MKSSTQAALVGIVVLGPGLARAEADLSVSKTATPEFVVENRLIDYTIIVSNAGPDEARNVEIVDDLPEDVVLTEADSRCVTVTPTGLRCTLGDIAAGESRTLQIQVRAPAIFGLPPVEQTVTNSANVTTIDEDPVIDNDGDQANVEVVPEENAADLALNLRGVEIFNEVQFTLEVFNNSALVVDDVTAVLQAEQLTLSEISDITTTQGTCLTPLDTCIGIACDGLENEPAEVVCELGTLIESATQRAVVTLSTQNIDDTPVTATGSVSGARADPDLTNNSDTAIADATRASLDGIGASCVASRLAAGRPMERDLNHLRRCRDRIKRFAWGRRFVAEYYRISPTLSAWLTDRPYVCAVLRTALKPILAIARRF